MVTGPRGKVHRARQHQKVRESLIERKEKVGGTGVATEVSVVAIIITISASLTVCPFVSVRPFVYLSACLFPFVCLSVCLSMHIRESTESRKIKKQ